MSRLQTTHKRLAIVAVVLAVVLTTVATAAPAGTVLVVEDIETGERYLTEPVESGTTVGLEYTHSVEKNRVYDGYRVDGETLVNTRMEFESYGWGLPSRVNVTTVNGTFVYDPPEPIAEFDTLSVSPGRIADHRLTVGTEQYDLVELTDANDVRIYVETQSVLDMIT
ncbi:DUF1850 domain-containing protein [Salinibaculum rarum]|jgi:hypothetical protein|uniref:DUF1850 domain-containing protein n=1 Tax=Salinibaculum rarum TaxID=3058903 RepID=UPI00265EA7DA|nr:DUF1850 domain-containing protein [Salinibaculum sp. KK48]